MNHSSPKEPLYSPTPDEIAEQGLHFQCQRCGNCCRWRGDVIIEKDEVSNIAGHLGLSEEEFIADFTRLSANRKHLSLIDKNNHECIFLEGIECTIQSVKPRQCEGFPNKWNFKDWRQDCEAVPVKN